MTRATSPVRFARAYTSVIRSGTNIIRTLPRCSALPNSPYVYKVLWDLGPEIPQVSPEIFKSYSRNASQIAQYARQYSRAYSMFRSAYRFAR